MLAEARFVGSCSTASCHRESFQEGAAAECSDSEAGVAGDIEECDGFCELY